LGRQAIGILAWHDIGLRAAKGATAGDECYQFGTPGIGIRSSNGSNNG
jgi:hypothetical protein